MIVARLPLLLSPSLLVFKVDRSDISLAAKAVTSFKLTATEVAALIVFKFAAVALVLSSLPITTVHAFVSFPPPGLYNVVKSLTLAAVSIDPVTVPVVSAAIDLA